jgi:hypothetical protein
MHKWVMQVMVTELPALQDFLEPISTLTIVGTTCVSVDVPEGFWPELSYFRFSKPKLN